MLNCWPFGPPLKPTCPDFAVTTTDELLQLVKLTDDREILVCACQRAIWAEIGRRGGIQPHTDSGWWKPVKA